MVQEPPLLQWPTQVRQLGATRPSEQLQEGMTGWVDWEGVSEVLRKGWGREGVSEVLRKGQGRGGGQAREREAGAGQGQGRAEPWGQAPLTCR